MGKRYYNYGGFLEEKVMEYDIDNNDLQILSYISMIQASDKMEIIFYQDDYYVWVKSEKLVEDNPRLRIKRRALETRVAYLIEKGLLKKVVKCDKYNVKKSYYRTTDKFRDMMFTNFDLDIDEGQCPQDVQPMSDKSIEYRDKILDNRDNNNKKEIIKEKYGEFNNVSLSGEELEKLREKFPKDYQNRIEKLSAYIASTGKKYKSHYATILNWSRKEEQSKPQSTFNKNYTTADYEGCDF